MTRWTFRPTALQRSNYSSLTVKQLTDHYVGDNDRALKEGVVVPPPPSRAPLSSSRRHSLTTMDEKAADDTTRDATATKMIPVPTNRTHDNHSNHEQSHPNHPGRVSPSPGCHSRHTEGMSSSSSSSSSSVAHGKRQRTIDGNDCIIHTSAVKATAAAPLRTLQWNIQAFTSPRGERSPYITNGIIDTIHEADADVIVLNEYHWKDQHRSQEQFEGEYLRAYGYNDYYCGSVITPTLIASRKPVLQFEEIILSRERSAMCVKIDAACQASLPTNDSGIGNNDDDASGLIWVIGTHLDAFNGQQRLVEIEQLLAHMKNHPSIFDPSVPILLMGDFNQQRQKDYPLGEWQQITTSMDSRRVCRDDGVASMLEENGFQCVFDVVISDDVNKGTDAKSTSIATKTADLRLHQLQTNWETSHPPSTHWSGTTIDYSYAVGDVIVDGVFISPAGFSDHRMTVCDWSVPIWTSRARARRHHSSSPSSLAAEIAGTSCASDINNNNNSNDSGLRNSTSMVVVDVAAATTTIATTPVFEIQQPWLL
jgi:endonuclease/exonuclease/phosphatase family metal-dependent hydrolase